MELADKKCLSCKSGSKALNESESRLLLKQLHDWTLEDGKALSKTFAGQDFAHSLQLANKIGAIAEEEGHHPDLLVRWGALGVRIWTHSVGALTEADFILAAKIDRQITR